MVYIKEFFEVYVKRYKRGLHKEFFEVYVKRYKRGFKNGMFVVYTVFKIYQ